MVKRIGVTLGFTLIEMAIVLVVVGLLLSGGLTAVAPVLLKPIRFQTSRGGQDGAQGLRGHNIQIEKMFQRHGDTFRELLKISFTSKPKRPRRRRE